MTSSNTTNHSTSPTDFSENLTILKIFLLYVQPLIGCIGLAGNVLTFIILSKQGIRKSSNIIILSLTLADCLFLMRSVNAFHLLARLDHPYVSLGLYGWETSIQIGYFMYISDKVTSTLEHWGGYVATNMPVVITVERFIAVFFPLKFKTLLTAKKVLLISIAVWIGWLPWIASSLFYYSVGSFTPSSSKMFVYLHLSQMLIDGFEIINRLDDYFFNFISSIVPISLVCVGCVLIGVKIRITQIERKRLATTGKTSSLRTTRTLFHYYNGKYHQLKHCRRPFIDVIQLYKFFYQCE
ncbi:hypothetical protein Btru_045484 [Bulinus truncatus]|nr:hypothetical protein Btru_045484 [Bulinus truncatus]